MQLKSLPIKAESLLVTHKFDTLIKPANNVAKIKINVISPGNILLDGNVWDKKIKKDKKGTLKYIKKNVPLNDFCKPEQIKDLCDYLLSNSGDFITGSNFIIDGGQVANG